MPTKPPVTTTISKRVIFDDQVSDFSLSDRTTPNNNRPTTFYAIDSHSGCHVSYAKAQANPK